MRIVEAVRKPLRVVRLRHQVSSLQLALDTAWENLGTLALGHRPFHPRLAAELPELSALQQQVGEKQGVADSLRRPKGAVRCSGRLRRSYRCYASASDG